MFGTLLVLAALCSTSNATRGSRVTIYNDTPFLMRLKPSWYYKQNYDPSDRVFLQPGWSTVMQGYNDGEPVCDLLLDKTPFPTLPCRTHTRALMV